MYIPLYCIVALGVRRNRLGGRELVSSSGLDVGRLCIYEYYTIRLHRDVYSLDIHSVPPLGIGLMSTVRVDAITRE
jgi:hypothetical protein